jgi:hypothetical protein
LLSITTSAISSPDYFILNIQSFVEKEETNWEVMESGKEKGTGIRKVSSIMIEKELEQIKASDLLIS